MNTDCSVCAPSNSRILWTDINWEKHEKIVKRLQERIVKAWKEKRYNKVKALQWLLTHSKSAKLLAIKKVTSNKGKSTAGVDGVLWETSKEKGQAVLKLKRSGYKPQPLRRIYIPKKDKSKKRPLSIPTMLDRAMQALHLMGLDPLVETTSDISSYGFRKGKSTADAISKIFTGLGRKTSARWILEGDILGCFDNINHKWLINNTPMDKIILEKWLKSGILFEGEWSLTEKGTPQGGVISPCLANHALNGFEEILRKTYKGRDEKGRRKKVHYVRYCDDFIITADKKEILENEIKPQISKFLSIRGLELSKEKTLITHIEQGFNFLGFNIQKVKNKLLIRPSKENVKRFLKEIKEVIKQNKTAKQENLINILNPKIRGWANYYRHVVSRKTYEKVDAQIWMKLYRWVYRRHPNKGKKWCVKRYFHYNNGSNWSFQAVDIKERLRVLYKCTDTKIIRHKLIRDNANPYDSEWRLYFEEREGYRLFESVNGQKVLYRIWKNQNGICSICNTKITRETGWKMHIKDKSKVILHPKCHRKIHSE